LNIASTHRPIVRLRLSNAGLFEGISDSLLFSGDRAALGAAVRRGAEVVATRFTAAHCIAMPPSHGLEFVNGHGGRQYHSEPKRKTNAAASFPITSKSRVPSETQQVVIVRQAREMVIDFSNIYGVAFRNAVNWDVPYPSGPGWRVQVGRAVGNHHAQLATKFASIRRKADPERIASPVAPVFNPVAPHPQSCHRYA
jgi:hypothetical protein